MRDIEICIIVTHCVIFQSFMFECVPQSQFGSMTKQKNWLEGLPGDNNKQLDKSSLR